MQAAREEELQHCVAEAHKCVQTEGSKLLLGEPRDVPEASGLLESAELPVGISSPSPTAEAVIDHYAAQAEIVIDLSLCLYVDYRLSCMFPRRKL